MRYKTLYFLVVFGFGVSAAMADTYSSKASCIRAGEAAETCDKLFPELAPPKPKPLPIAACTGMMKEAANHERQAIVALQFDAMEMLNSHVVQSKSLMQAAFGCAENSTPDGATDAAFRQAMEDWRTQHAILGAAMNAKTEASR